MPRTISRRYTYNVESNLLEGDLQSIPMMDREYTYNNELLILLEKIEDSWIKTTYDEINEVFNLYKGYNGDVDNLDEVKKFFEDRMYTVKMNDQERAKAIQSLRIEIPYSFITHKGRPIKVTFWIWKGEVYFGTIYSVLLKGKPTLKSGGGDIPEYNGEYVSGPIPTPRIHEFLKKYKTIDEDYNKVGNYVLAPRTNGYMVGKILRPYYIGSVTKDALVEFPDEVVKTISLKPDASNLLWHDVGKYPAHPVFKFEK